MTHVPRTAQERLNSYIEIEGQLHNNNLQSDPASKILSAISLRYVKTGIPVYTTLFLQNRYDKPRKFVIELQNDKRKKDVVFIRIMTDNEIAKTNKNKSLRQEATQISSEDDMPVGVGWSSKHKEEKRGEDSDDCPDLV